MPQLLLLFLTILSRHASIVSTRLAGATSLRQFSAARSWVASVPRLFRHFRKADLEGTRARGEPDRNNSHATIALFVFNNSVLARIDCLDTFSGSIKAYATISDTLVARTRHPHWEIGPPALSYSQWFGRYAPKGAPKDIVGKFNSVVVADPLSTTNSGLLRRGCDQGAVGQDYAC